MHWRTVAADPSVTLGGTDSSYLATKHLTRRDHGRLTQIGGSLPAFGREAAPTVRPMEGWRRVQSDRAPG